MLIYDTILHTYERKGGGEFKKFQIKIGRGDQIDKYNLSI